MEFLCKFFWGQNIKKIYLKKRGNAGKVGRFAQKKRKWNFKKGKKIEKKVQYIKKREEEKWKVPWEEKGWEQKNGFEEKNLHSTLSTRLSEREELVILGFSAKHERIRLLCERFSGKLMIDIVCISPKIRKENRLLIAKGNVFVKKYKEKRANRKNSRMCFSNKQTELFSFKMRERERERERARIEQNRFLTLLVGAFFFLLPVVGLVIWFFSLPFSA